MPFRPPNQDKYHVTSRVKHVDTPYDKNSPLYHPDLWNWHDLYDQQVSYQGSIVTRSQTAFNRIDIDESRMKLFRDRMRHHPPNLPHLIMTMKDGTYGAIPRTIITRSMAEQLEDNPTLTKTIDAYKSFEPMKSLFPDDKKRKTSVFNKIFKQDTNDTNININVQNDDKKNVKKMKHNYLCSPEPKRYVNQAKTNRSLGRKPKVLRESRFSLEVLGSLSQPKLSFSSACLSNKHKGLSFTPTGNSFTIAPFYSQSVENQSRQYQGNQASSHPFGVSRGFSIPSHDPRVFLSNQSRSFPQFHEQPLHKFK